MILFQEGRGKAKSVYSFSVNESFNLGDGREPTSLVLVKSVNSGSPTVSHARCEGKSRSCWEPIAQAQRDDADRPANPVESHAHGADARAWSARAHGNRYGPLNQETKHSTYAARRRRSSLRLGRVALADRCLQYCGLYLRW